MKTVSVRLTDGLRGVVCEVRRDLTPVQEVDFTGRFDFCLDRVSEDDSICLLSLNHNDVPFSRTHPAPHQDRHFLVIRIYGDFARQSKPGFEVLADGAVVWKVELQELPAGGACVYLMRQSCGRHWFVAGLPPAQQERPCRTCRRTY